MHKWASNSGEQFLLLFEVYCKFVKNTSINQSKFAINLLVDWCFENQKKKKDGQYRLVLIDTDRKTLV
jgi:hypothetical protein